MRTGYPRKWKITTKQIASACGKTEKQVRVDVRSGRCNPDDLFGFACYVVGHRAPAGVQRASRETCKPVKQASDDRAAKMAKLMSLGLKKGSEL
jgi:hypothetical protein